MACADDDRLITLDLRPVALKPSFNAGNRPSVNAK